MAVLTHISHKLNKAIAFQVCKLRPGRRYAFRLVCVLDIPPTLTPPASQPTSPPVAFANPATVPGAPLAPKLGGRGRTNLTVGVDFPLSAVGCFTSLPGHDLWLVAQWRWAEPEDTGGRDVYEYHLQMISPVKEQEAATPKVMQCFPPLLSTNARGAQQLHQCPMLLHCHILEMM